MDWRRVAFTEHMTEAAALVGACRVVLDFGAERACYTVEVWESLKGGGAERYFATATNVDDPRAYRPLGAADTPEAAAQACLAAAGVYHRRRVKQAGE
jgi:hypothetical protein